MHTTQFNHAPAQIFMNTGHQMLGRPSLGSWLTYGLGSESEDLPGFVVLLSGENEPDGGKSCWGSGFLPTVYQGVEFRSKGDPVLFVSNPDGVDAGARGATRSTLVDRSQPAAPCGASATRRSTPASPPTRWRFGCSRSVPELMDISSEPAPIHEMYGTEPGKASFANNCLLARRLVERGVRFVQLYHRGWDTTAPAFGDDIVDKLPELCRETDHAVGRAVKDLKQRGLLDDDARRLGRRVRPHADERSAQRLEVPRPRPPSARVHDLAGRRRHQARHHASAAPTNSATTPSRTRSTSTTCTPRCCTSSASITRS